MKNSYEQASSIKKIPEPINSCKLGYRCDNSKFAEKNIYNDEIWRRNILIKNPEVYNINPPKNTSVCIHSELEPTLSYSGIDDRSRSHWFSNFIGSDKEIGLPVNGINTDHDNLRGNYQNPNIKSQPWKYGINKNIDSESRLRRLGVYDNMDCIPADTIQEYRQKHKENNFMMYKNCCSHSSNYPTETPSWFNNTTKVLNNFGANQSYEDFVCNHV